MFTKTLAVAIAGLVAIAALGATTTTASAAYWGHAANRYNAYPGDRPYAGSGRDDRSYNWSFNRGGAAWYFNQRVRPYVDVQPAAQRVCKPVYSTVQVWKPHYGWVWATVYGGQQCWLQPVYPSQTYGYGW